ncbi:MAG: class I SAM-dependent methyltransferase [Pseudomonadota bacterium]
MTDLYKTAPESFSEKLVTILNMGAMNLAMGIGYRVGLYDAMDTFESPQKASVIAGKAGLNLRYTLEWLSIMATGGIITLTKDSSGNNLYHLPKSHADLLTRRAGNANMGVYTQEIPILAACAMDPVANAFSSGEGIPYANYMNFHTFMSELANAKHRRVLVNHFLPSVDNGAIVKKIKAGIRVCDLGCSEGIALLIMAQAFPKSEFVGMDISGEAVAEAQKEAGRQGLSNATFILIDAATLSENESYEGAFDYITAFDAIHDQSRPLAALKGVHHMLADGGTFSMVDIAAHTDVTDNLGHAMGPFLYTVSLMHCMPVGLVDFGEGLGMMWGREKALEMLGAAGFGSVSVEEIPDDPFNLHFFCRK